MEFSTEPTKAVPHLDVNADTGNFVYAVYQMPPGNDYMAEGTSCTWPEWIETWSKVTGVPATYKQVAPEEMIKATPDVDLGIEATYMFSYMSDPGYDGGMDVLTAADLVKVSCGPRFLVEWTDADPANKAGIACPMTSLDEWMRSHDWASVLAKESRA